MGIESAERSGLVGRRSFLETATRLAGLTAYSLIGLRILQHTRPRPEDFYYLSADSSPDQLGVNINLKSIEWLRQNKRKTSLTPLDMVNVFLDAGIRSFRLHLPLSLTYVNDGTFTFELFNPLIDAIIKNRGKLALQAGFKTFGYPEVSVPEPLIKRFPSILHPGPIDLTSELKDIGWTYYDQTLQFIHSLPDSSIDSFQPENEALSKNLPHTKCRFIPGDFYLQIVDFFRSRAPGIPILQNLPLDNLDPLRKFNQHDFAPRQLAEKFRILIRESSTISQVTKASDIVGINIYNQAGEKIPWPLFNLLSTGIRLLNRRFSVTEMQAARFIDEHLNTVYDYRADQFLQSLFRVFGTGPERVFLWGVELWFADYHPALVRNQLEGILSLVRSPGNLSDVGIELEKHTSPSTVSPKNQPSCF